MDEKTKQLYEFLKNKNYISADLFELSEEDKELYEFETVDEKLESELSSDMENNYAKVHPVGSEEEILVFFNEQGIADYIKEVLTYDMEEKAVIDLVGELSNNYKEVLELWGMSPKQEDDYLISYKKPSELLGHKKVAIVKEHVMNKKTAAGTGIGNYRRGEVLADISNVSPGQLIVYESIRFKATNLVKVTETFADKFYGVFVSPENPAEKSKSADEEFAVVPEDLVQGEYYIALEPAPETEPEVEDIETGIKEPAETEIPPEGTAVEESPEAPVEKEEEKELVGASKKTAMVSMVSEEDIEKMTNEILEEYNKDLPEGYELYIGQSVNTNYPSVNITIPEEDRSENMDEYHEFYYLDSGYVNETINSFREKGEIELADKLDPDSENYDEEYAEIFFELDALHGFDSGRNWDEWIQDFAFLYGETSSEKVINKLKTVGASKKTAMIEEAGIYQVVLDFEGTEDELKVLVGERDEESVWYEPYPEEEAKFPSYSVNIVLEGRELKDKLAKLQNLGKIAYIEVYLTSGSEEREQRTFEGWDDIEKELLGTEMTEASKKIAEEKKITDEQLGYLEETIKEAEVITIEEAEKLVSDLTYADTPYDYNPPYVTIASLSEGEFHCSWAVADEEMTVYLFDRYYNIPNVTEEQYDAFEEKYGYSDEQDETEATKKEAIESPVREKMDYGEQPWSADERQKQIQSKLDKLSVVSDIDLDAYADSGETVSITLNSNQAFSGVIEKEETGRYLVYSNNEAKISNESPISPQFEATDVTQISRIPKAYRASKKVATDLPENMVDSYLVTALWSSTDIDPDDPSITDTHLDENYTTDDVAEESREKAQKDCDVFLVKAKEIISKIDPEYVLDESMAGHDFWLTRNGHGAGFWDGDYPEEIGGALTELSTEFGETDALIGEDNLIHLEGGKDVQASKKTALTVPEQHQKKIALDTLRMPDAMVGVMGGMDKDEARAFLSKIGYSDEKIKQLEASKKTMVGKVRDLPAELLSEHKLTINSLSDANAECSAGDWSFVRTGLITKEELTKEFNKHLKNVKTGASKKTAQDTPAVAFETPTKTHITDDELVETPYAKKLSDNESLEEIANKLRSKYPQFKDFKFWKDGNKIKGQAYGKDEGGFWGNIYDFDLEGEILTPVGSKKGDINTPLDTTPFARYAEDTPTSPTKEAQTYEEDVYEDEEEEKEPEYTHELVSVDIEEEDQPLDDDIIINEDYPGPLSAFYEGKEIAVSKENDMDEIATKIAEYLEGSNYFPAIWGQGERGNLYSYILQKKGALDNFEVDQEIVTSGDYAGIVGDHSSPALNLLVNTETLTETHTGLASAPGGEGDDGSAYDLLKGRNFTGVNEDIVEATVEEYLAGKAISFASFDDFAGFINDVYDIDKTASVQLKEAWHLNDPNTIISFIKENAKQDLLG